MSSKLIAGVALILLCVSGCDRGSHPSQTGQAAPDFTLNDGTNHIRLADLRGKVVVLNFWATWCPPCIAELPSLLAMQHQLPGVVVLAVSTDEDEHAYRQFLSDHHVDLLTIRDGSQTAAGRYKTEQFPETYIIDRQGFIRRKFIGAQDWTSPEIVHYLTSL